ncbi:MAG: HesA/MoeB/ThiF family protein [Longimicrobiales bacterium]
MDASTQVGQCRVVVVGTGGNIGSHLVPHLARMASIGWLTLIDPDVYEEHNLQNQAIAGWAVGENKARVQAHVIHGINPGIEITVCAERVEDVPLGLLRADLILACLDNRRARQYVNEAAWQLGVPWLDAGVLADGLLARLDLYIPAPAAPCLECRWDTADYAALEQKYACEGDAQAAPATAAPSALGALAAALQALECERLLSARAPAGSLVAGEQIVLAAAHHRHYRTMLKRNAHCRLGAHEVWTIAPLDEPPETSTVGSLLDRIAQQFGPHSDIRLSIAGKQFVRALTCHTCDQSQPTLCLSSAAAARTARCGRCHGAMVISGFGMSEQLEAAALSAAERATSLSALGIRAHEIITLTMGGADYHIEFCPAPAPRSAMTDQLLLGVAS